MIDTEELRRDLPQRRWFGDKGREIQRVQILDAATITDGPPALEIAIASVGFGDGVTHLYHLVVLVEQDGTTRDATEDIDRLRVLGELMTHGETIKGSQGRFHFGGPGLDPRSPPGSGSIRLVGAEQSNTSVVFDEDVILKLFRRVENGPNPDLELNRLLTNDGFENIPPHVGELSYEGRLLDEEVEIDLGIAQSLVKDARGGWEETLEQLAELYAAAGTVSDVEAATQERAAKNLDELMRLGGVTASLHVLFAREELDPEVISEPVTDQDVKEWTNETAMWLDRALGQGVEEVNQYAGAIRERIEETTNLSDLGRKTRVHGDYHLGQVLLAPRGWMILDFEGEPLRPLEERRAKRSPLKDVAGMLRSFGYAASVSLFEQTDPGTQRWDDLEPWSRAWEALARDRFLSAYLRTSHEGGFLPSDRSELLTLLDLFELEKALYELNYEIGHRPEWVRIPLRGIETVLDRAKRR